MQAQPTTDAATAAPPPTDTPTPPAPATTPPPLRCTPTLIDSARADAIEALQAILKETAPLDIFDDLPARTRATEQADGTTDTDAPRRHSPRGRALRLSIRLRAATALLRLRVATTPSPRIAAPASATNVTTRARRSDDPRSPHSTPSAPSTHSPTALDTDDDTNEDDTPTAPRHPRSARTRARDEAAARRAKAERTFAIIAANNEQAYQNYLEIGRQADLREAARAAASAAATAALAPSPTAAVAAPGEKHPAPA